MKVGAVPAAAAAAAAALLVGGVRLVDPIFGLYGSTADQLETLLDLDEAPPALVGLVRIGRPLYEPLKAVSSSCTEGVFPEFNDELDMNDCLLLPNRLFWRSGETSGRPLLIRQTMGRGSMWETSTGSSVWGGGIVLQRYLEQELGRAALSGKRVIELGTGTGLGAITAASLGAGEVLATDRDPAVLKLAEANARANLGDLNSARFHTSLLTWGESLPPEAASMQWDLVIGADLTYNREAWPALVEALRALRAPAVLTASERRPDELRTLQTFLFKEGLEVEVIDSPMTRGYAKTKVRILSIAAPTESPAVLVYERKRPVEGAPTPTKSTARSSSLSIRPGALAAPAAPAAPSKRELAGGLLRLRFNRPGTPSWWEVDAPLKKARLDWAYKVVSEPGYTEAQAPEAPESLL